MAMNEFDRVDSTQCGESLMSLVTAIQFIDNLHMSPTTSAISTRLKLGINHELGLTPSCSNGHITSTEDGQFSSQIFILSSLFDRKLPDSRLPEVSRWASRALSLWSLLCSFRVSPVIILDL